MLGAFFMPRFGANWFFKRLFKKVVEFILVRKSTYNWIVTKFALIFVIMFYIHFVARFVTCWYLQLYLILFRFNYCVNNIPINSPSSLSLLTNLKNNRRTLMRVMEISFQRKGPGLLYCQSKRARLLVSTVLVKVQLCWRHQICICLEQGHLWGYFVLCFARQREVLCYSWTWPLALLGSREHLVSGKCDDWFIPTLNMTLNSCCLKMTRWYSKVSNWTFDKMINNLLKWSKNVYNCSRVVTIIIIYEFSITVGTRKDFIQLYMKIIFSVFIFLATYLVQ